MIRCSKCGSQVGVIGRCKTCKKAERRDCYGAELPPISESDGTLYAGSDCTCADPHITTCRHLPNCYEVRQIALRAAQSPRGDRGR